MKGLSSTGLQNTTSLAAPKPFVSLVSSAAFFITSPIVRTASMLIPALVLPIETDEHTRSVTLNASGIASNNVWSLFVMPLCTSAE